MSLHPNSLAAYHDGKLDTFPPRCRAILSVIAQIGEATDRVICDRLRFRDMNSVRPRITELVKAGVLAEKGSTKDPVTGARVRVVGVKEFRGRQLAFL